MSSIFKGGWHPEGKGGKKESWRGDFKGINQIAGKFGKGQSSSSEQEDRAEHVSRPLNSLKDRMFLPIVDSVSSLINADPVQPLLLRPHLSTLHITARPLYLVQLLRIPEDGVRPYRKRLYSNNSRLSKLIHKPTNKQQRKKRKDLLQDHTV